MSRKWQNVFSFGFLMAIISCFILYFATLFKIRYSIPKSILMPLYIVLVILMAIGGALMVVSAWDDKDLR